MRVCTTYGHKKSAGLLHMRHRFGTNLNSLWEAYAITQASCELIIARSLSRGTNSCRNWANISASYDAVCKSTKFF